MIDSLETTPLKNLEYVRRDLALLVVLCMCAFIPGMFQLPVLDRDEARFAVASKQMAQSGDWVDIRFQNEPRYKKPVGIYWLQATAVKTAELIKKPAQIGIYRLPSLLGALMGVLAVYLFSRKVFDRERALCAAIMMATTILIMAEARIAKTDAMLLGLITTAQSVMGWMFIKATEQKRSDGTAVVFALTKVPFYLFWGALSCAILIKGPIAPLVIGLTLAALCVWDRSLSPIKMLRPLWGLKLVAIVTLPWFIAIYVKTNGAFFAHALGHDLGQKLTSGQESHGAPPLTYLASMLVTFWPWAALMGLGLVGAYKHMTSALPKSPVVVFCLAWIVPTWLVFELIPTKLPHYILPILPPLAIVTARYIHDSVEWAHYGFVRHGSARVVLIVMGALFLLVPCAALAAMIYVYKLSQLSTTEIAFSGVILAGIFSAISLMLYQAIRKNLAFAVVKAYGLSGVILAGILTTLIMPRAGILWLSTTAYETFSPLMSTCRSPEIYVGGYYEPSLVFYFGSGIERKSAAEIAALPEASEQENCRYAILESAEKFERLKLLSPEKEFLKRAQTAGIKTHKIAEVTGRNLNGFRDRTLNLYLLRAP